MFRQVAALRCEITLAEIVGQQPFPAVDQGFVDVAFQAPEIIQRVIVMAIKVGGAGDGQAVECAGAALVKRGAAPDAVNGVDIDRAGEQVTALFVRRRAADERLQECPVEMPVQVTAKRLATGNITLYQALTLLVMAEAKAFLEYRLGTVRQGGMADIVEQRGNHQVPASVCAVVTF